MLGCDTEQSDDCIYLTSLISLNVQIIMWQLGSLRDHRLQFTVVIGNDIHVSALEEFQTVTGS